MQLPPQQWAAVLETASVLVLTSDTLLNVLNDPRSGASFDQLSLLVIDECHHCHGETPQHR